MNKRWTERQGKEGKQKEIVCKLWTQEPENFDEEVKSLGTAWRLAYLSFSFKYISWSS